MFFEVIRYRGRRRVGVDAYTRSGVFHNQASTRAGNDRAGIAPTPPPFARIDELCIDEPSEMTILLWERGGLVGFSQIGPLTREQTESEQSYLNLSDMEDEDRMFRAAGGRSVCPRCGERAVKHGSACTLGYPGHPGAEWSATYSCEKCDYQDVA